MKRISSRMTFFYKQVFPIFWFGFLAVFIFVAFVSKNTKNSPPAFALIMPLFMGAFGYFICKKLLWDLADEVTDSGDSLIVRFGHEQEQISLSNIINVSYSYLINPPRVTLTLRTPSRFGEEISFTPLQRFTLNPFARSPIVADLIRRVDAARR
jgi:hypothetical protein